MDNRVKKEDRSRNTKISNLTFWKINNRITEPIKRIKKKCYLFPGLCVIKTFSHSHVVYLDFFFPTLCPLMLRTSSSYIREQSWRRRCLSCVLLKLGDSLLAVSAILSSKLFIQYFRLAGLSESPTLNHTEGCQNGTHARSIFKKNSTLACLSRETLDFNNNFIGKSCF